MSDSQFYSSVIVSVLAFYLLPGILFFYLWHLYKKYKKPNTFISSEDEKEYQKIKALEKLLKGVTDIEK